MFAAFQASNGKATQYEIAGRVTYQQTEHDGKIRSLRDYAFTVNVDGCRWQINQELLRFIKGGNERTNLPLISYVCSSDLTNLYSISTMGTNGVKLIKPLSNRSSGFIGTGDAPYGLSSSSTYVLWYAFASSCYFERVTNEYIHPVITLDSSGDYARDYRVRSKWGLAEAPPHLPKMISFGMYQSHMNNSGKPVRQDIFESTNCILAVKSFTNLGSYVFPKEVSAQYFVFPDESNYAIRLPEATVTVEVTNILLASSLREFTPHIDGAAFLTDLRPVKHEVPVRAVLGIQTNWPNLSASERNYSWAIAAYDRAESRANKQLSLTRFVTMLFLVISSLVFFIVISKNWLAKTK